MYPIVVFGLFLNFLDLSHISNLVSYLDHLSCFLLWVQYFYEFIDQEYYHAEPRPVQAGVRFQLSEENNRS